MIFVYIPEIGNKIRQLRTQRKLSQGALGSLLGVSKSVISAYENDVNSPPYDALIKIAQIFNVSTDYLLGMSKNKTINVDGLTNTQIEAVVMVVNELKKMNSNR